MKTKTYNMQYFKFLAVAVAGALMMSSCSREVSNSTGWDYNSPETGGFQKVPFIDQETGPGLLLVEGGTFTMGRAEQDVMFDWNNRPARITVSSFYMDQTEVTNFHWLEYLYWISRAYNETYPMVYKNALPDTLVWRSELGFNEKYVDYYLRHPAYRDYPVVGVSWLQASDYCKWRTDRVNEYILIREGIIGFNTEATNADVFNTDAYYANQHVKGENKKGYIGRDIPDLNPSSKPELDKNKLGTRIARLEDGILLPRYRLPTEAEWEFAASGLIGNVEEGTENIKGGRIYPWDGHWVRQDDSQFTGQIRANFVRGRGDYMGVAGHLNDGADVTAPVESYWPNDYGLYHMAGNVSEWVMDVYRPLTSEDYDEFRPFRGNVFQTKVLSSDGKIDLKNGQVQYDVHGMKEYLNEFERIRYQRISANEHDITDTVISDGLKANINSRNPIRGGSAPDPFYVSHGKIKDSLELALLAEINGILDIAIDLKNNMYDSESSVKIQDDLFDELLDDVIRENPDTQEEYSFEIVSILRDGFNDFIINTPGTLKYRNVTEEENIGRLNYRKDDYIDYIDGDIESSIYYKNDDRKNGINEATRDPNLVMYQNKYEQYGLDGVAINSDPNSSRPTTLVSDRSRVYKGGSWKDRAYWLAASNRRYLDQGQSTDAIGFRCAMDRVGSPTGMNYGRNKKKKK